jgi:hypothetical protein
MLSLQFATAMVDLLMTVENRLDNWHIRWLEAILREFISVIYAVKSMLLDLLITDIFNAVFLQTQTKLLTIGRVSVFDGSTH